MDPVEEGTRSSDVPLQDAARGRRRKSLDFRRGHGCSSSSRAPTEEMITEPQAEPGSPSDEEISEDDDPSRLRIGFPPPLLELYRTLSEEDREWVRRTCLQRAREENATMCAGASMDYALSNTEKYSRLPVEAKQSSRQSC